MAIDGTRRGYLKKAEKYRRDAAYYTGRGDVDRAKRCSRYAEDETDRYEVQLRYAAQADEIAEMYLRKAADVLRKRQCAVEYSSRPKAGASKNSFTKHPKLASLSNVRAKIMTISHL